MCSCYDFKICPLQDKELFHWYRFVNFLPNDQILDWSKLKAFADDKMNVAETMIYVYGRVENVVGKGENTDYQFFLARLSTTCSGCASVIGHCPASVRLSVRP